MNDFFELEQRLRELRPIAPSQDLVRRVERLLADSSIATSTAAVLSRKPRFNWNWLSLGLGLAAATAILFVARINFDKPQPTAKQIAANSSPKPAASVQTAEFVPSDFTRVVYHTTNEGLRFPSGSTRPMRRMRTHTRETFEWQNPQTGASLRVSYPSDEVSLTPVSGQ